MVVEYKRTKNEYWVKQWLQNFESWATFNPYLKSKPENYSRGNYVWFDMQVTWRLLVMLQSWPMIKDSPSVDAESKQFFQLQIIAHAQYLKNEALHELSAKTRKPVGNHFQQKGYALLHAAVSFPALFPQKEYLELADRILKKHYVEEIFADGSSIEGSPSYSHFIARMYVDCYLLLKNNKLPVFPYLQEAFIRQYKHLARTISPEGKTLIFGDSYSFDADKDLRLVESLTNNTFTRGVNTSVVFPDSKMTLLKNDAISVYVNGMGPGRFSHHHAGAPSLLVYHNGKPAIWEAGMTNYDHNSNSYHRSTEAHSSVLIEPKSKQRYDWSIMRKNPPVINIIAFDKEKSSVTYQYTYQRKSFKLDWTREITLNNESILVKDTVESNTNVEATQLFNLARSNSYTSRKDKTLYVVTDSSKLSFPYEKNNPYHIVEKPFKNSKNQYYIGKSIRKSSSGKHVELISEIHFSTLK